MTTVDRAFEAALYSDSEAALDTGASLLAADPSSDTELALRGIEFVTTAWRRGWQPADLDRLVRDRLGAPHAAILYTSITAETARYEALPERWVAQIERLREQSGRERPAPREDRFSTATRVLELHRLLLRLPGLEHAGPVPGEVPSGPVAGEPRGLGRIRALLAKAEATTFPEEAEALSAKAQELMARHSVDEAVLAARAPAGDVPTACRIGVDAPYETAKAVLLDAVASANHCRAVWNGEFGFSTVVGFDADLRTVELLHASLLVQGQSAMVRAEAQQRAAGRGRTKTFRQSFFAAYAHRVGDRLSSVAREITEEEAGRDGGLLPVLAARDVAVGATADALFPETVTTRMRGVTDAAGWQDGTDAADRAALRPAGKRLEGGRGRREGT